MQNSYTPYKTERKCELPHAKRILIVDDDSDITLTFKTLIECANNDSGKWNFEVDVVSGSIFYSCNYIHQNNRLQVSSHNRPCLSS
jgi:hypothetical protein